LNAQVLDKALASDKPVPAGPLQTQGDANDQGGEWIDVKGKKKKKKKKKKDGTDDAPEVAAAPAPPNKNRKDKGKGKAKGKGKGPPATPRSSNNGNTTPRGTPLTAEQKAARPCMFYAHNMCKAGKKCEFLHDDNNMYTGPPPRIANPKGKAKPGVAASVALAAGFIPGAESKAAQESVWTKAFACVSSIINKQQPAGGMLRKLSRAAVTLAATTTGQTLPNFGISAVNNYSTMPSFAGTDIAGLIARPKATPQFEVEWIGDTGAGRNLSSLKQLPPEAEKFVGNSKHPVNFSTGGGVKDGGKSVGLNAGLAKGDELFLLKNCPNALSTGLQVNDHKRPFLWLLDQVQRQASVG
jgi:hypothetical protein